MSQRADPATPAAERHSRVLPPSRHDRLDRALLIAVDAGLAACVFVVPFLMGGRHAVGQFALVALAMTTALVWAARQCLLDRFSWRRSPVEWFVLAGLTLLLVQTAPLEPAILARIAPQIGKVLPLWSGPEVGPLGAWTCVSLAPGAARAAVPLFLSYGLLLLVAVQRVRRVEDVERLLRWAALSATLMAAFGLVQWAAGNGKFFWFYDHPFSDTSHCVTGSFTNRNHFAQFMALGIGPLLWWLQEALAARAAAGTLLAPAAMVRGASRLNWGPRPGHGAPGRVDPATLRVLALALVLFAGLMTLSRGGALALAAAALVSIAVSFRAKLLGRRFLLALAGLALLTTASLAIHGYQQVSNRLGDLTSGSFETLDHDRSRRAIWAANLRAARDFLPLGSGVGSHADVYHLYLDSQNEREYTHAENSPLQVFLEAGIPGLLLVLAAVGLCGSWCVGALRRCGGSPFAPRKDAAFAERKATTPQPLRRPSPGGRDATLPRRIFLAAGAIAASLAANLVHAFVDFVWYVPGCMVLVAIFAACACRLRQMAAQQVENTNTGPARTSAVLEYPRYVAVAVVGLLAFGGLWLTFDLPSRAVAQIHWERYQRLTRRAGQVSNLTVPSDRSFPLARHIAELETVVRWNPDHARAHLRLAEAYLQRFEWLQQSSECAMPLSQIGDAATYGGFTTREEAERWLSQVLGERRADLDRARRHVLTGLRLSPLQGEGYVYLAELRPLEGPGAAAVKPALMSQALAVRPFDGDVLLQAGRAASLAGDLTLAIQHWQRSFRAGPLHRQQIVALLAERVPVAFFLDAFGPDQTSLRDMHDWYVKLEGPAEAQRLCGLYRQLSGAAPPGDEQEPAAAAAWLRGQVTQIRQRWVGMAEEEAARTTGPKAAVAWLTAASIHRLQKDRQAEFRCAESALRCDPGSLAAHLAMAECLIAAGRCADAGSHLSWCLERRPNDSQLRAMLRATVTKRLDQEGRAASAAAGTRR